jgi:hypothetical protein
MTMHTVSPGWAVIGVLTILAAAPACASAGDAHIILVQRPAELRPAAVAEVQAVVEGVARCRLQLRAGATTTSSSLVAATGDARLSWRWRVPRGTRRGTFRGTVACWAAPLPAHVARTSPDVSRSFFGSLHGSRGGRMRLVGASGLAGVVASQPPDRRPTSQRAAEWATVVGIVLGLIGAFGALRSLRASRLQAQSERTERMIESYGKREFLETWTRVMGLLRAADEAEAVEQIRRSESTFSTNAEIEPYGLAPVPAGLAPEDVPKRTVTRTEALNAANFYEGLAALYNTEKLDRRLVMSSFQPIMPQTLEAAWWWIHYQREGRRAAARVPLVRSGETDTYCEWERMVRRIARGSHDLDARTLNDEGLDDAVRALCLPRASGTKATDAQWRRSKELSLAVGALVGTQPGRDLLHAELAKAPLPDPAEPVVPERTLLVPRCRDHLPEPGPIARRMCALGARVELGGPWWMRGRGGRLADRDPRVADHKRLHALAVLLDRVIDHHGLEATLAIVERLGTPAP